MGKLYKIRIFSILTKFCKFITPCFKLFLRYLAVYHIRERSLCIYGMPKLINKFLSYISFTFHVTSYFVAKINIIIGKCKELRENKKAEALSLCLL